MAGCHLPGNTSSLQRQCDALGRVLLGNLGSWHPCACYFDITYLSVVTNNAHPFMETIFLVCCGLFHQGTHQWFDEHNNEFKALTWPTYFPNLNPIKHLWDLLGKQVRSTKDTPCILQVLKDLLLTFQCRILKHTGQGLVERPRVRAILATQYWAVGRNIMFDQCKKLEVKLQRQGREHLDMCRGKRVVIFEQRMLNAELPGRKIRQGSQRMFMDVVKKDMHRVGVTEEDTGDIAH